MGRPELQTQSFLTVSSQSAMSRSVSVSWVCVLKAAGLRHQLDAKHESNVLNMRLEGGEKKMFWVCCVFPSAADVLEFPFHNEVQPCVGNVLRWEKQRVDVPDI